MTLLIAAATSYRTVRRRQRRSGRAGRGGARPGGAQERRRAAGRTRSRLSAAVPPRHARPRRVEGRCRPTSACAAFADGSDPGLAALYFQYGRYLLIASSRPGSQPANLQGIWNDSMSPPWGSKYTININTRDELLAGAVDQPGRDDGSADRDGGGPDRDRRAHRARHVRRRRLGGASQHRSVARHRRRSTVRSGACGRPAAHG